MKWWWWSWKRNWSSCEIFYYFILGHTLCRSVWYMIDMHVDWTPSLSDSQVEWEIFLPSLVRYKNLAWCRQTNVHTRTHTPENSLITFVNVIYFYVSKARICDFLLSSHIVFFFCLWFVWWCKNDFFFRFGIFWVLFFVFCWFFLNVFLKERSEREKVYDFLTNLFAYGWLYWRSTCIYSNHYSCIDSSLLHQNHFEDEPYRVVLLYYEMLLLWWK